MAKLAFPNALEEITGMTKVVTDSDLDWTIARITNPTDKASKGTLRVGYLGRDKVGSAMSRTDRGKPIFSVTDMCGNNA